MTGTSLYDRTTGQRRILAETCNTHRGWRYRTPTGKVCCELNSVGVDRTGWFKADILSTDVHEGLVTVRFSLFFKNIGRYSYGSFSWQKIKWSNLGVMHGRRIHASAVAEDGQHAWHEHPNEPALRPDDMIFTIHFQLPATPPPAIRILFNFGLLADERCTPLLSNQPSPISLPARHAPRRCSLAGTSTSACPSRRCTSIPAQRRN